MAFFQTRSLWVNQLPDGVADLVLDVPGGKLNLLDPDVVADLGRALDVVEHDERFQLLLLRSGKGASFCHGLNRGWLGGLETEQDFANVASLGQHLTLRLAQLRLPVVAIISGACLGAGLDLALACDYRVVVARPNSILGFDEAELGLTPCWGATQRLPRLIGLEPALNILLSSRRLTSLEALAIGLADAVNPEGSDTPPQFLNNPKKRQPAGLPYRTWRQRLFESTRLMRWLIFRGGRRVLQRRVPDAMPAPWKIMEIVRTGLQEGLEAGLAAEAKAWIELSQTAAFHHLLHLHQLGDRIRGEFRFQDPKQRIRRVGIVGGGGRALALAALLAPRGFQVVLQADSDTALGFAMFRLLAHFQQEVQRGAMTQPDMVKNLGAIKGTTNYRGFDQLDLVLEALEDETADRADLFQELEDKTGPEVILAGTSAANSVAGLQAALDHPQRVAAFVFQAPAARSLLVEVAGSEKTAASTLRQLAEVAVGLGRTPRLVPDGAGFLVQRVLLPYFNEAVLLLREGTALDMIEAAMIRFGLPFGPLEHMDLMGLDVAWGVAQSLQSRLGSRLTFDKAFALLVEKNWLGQKTGVGFYRYRGRRRSQHRTLTRHLQRTYFASTPWQALSRADRLERTQQRLVAMLVNEAAWLLAEYASTSPQEIDDTLILAGIVPHRGGPLGHARSLGLDHLQAQLAELADLHGPRFAPCPALAQI